MCIRDSYYESTDNWGTVSSEIAIMRVTLDEDQTTYAYTVRSQVQTDRMRIAVFVESGGPIEGADVVSPEFGCAEAPSATNTATPGTPTSTPTTPASTPTTPTATPTTPTATATPVTPTTPTATATPVTPTATPITPTATATTASTPDSANTPTATVTNSPTPESTNTPAATATAVNTPTTTSTLGTLQLTITTEDGGAVPTGSRICVATQCQTASDLVGQQPSAAGMRSGTMWTFTGVPAGMAPVTVINAAPYADLEDDARVVAGDVTRDSLMLRLAQDPPAIST